MMSEVADSLRQTAKRAYLTLSTQPRKASTPESVPSSSPETTGTVIKTQFSPSYADYFYPLSSLVTRLGAAQEFARSHVDSTSIRELLGTITHIYISGYFLS